MISRGVTGDADNQLTSVLQRKHPHELLDSVVKERLVKSFSSQPRRAFYSVLCICQAVILRSFQSFLFNFNHLRFVRLGVSRQREANSTALQSAVNYLFHRCRFKHLNRSTSSLLTSSNSLILKEFSVSSAPEVGRIIERFRGASTLILIKLSYRSETALKAKGRALWLAPFTQLLQTWERKLRRFMT